MSEWRPDDELEDVIDGVETAQFARSNGTRLPLTHALRRAVRRREGEPSGGAVARSDVTWHVSAAELAEEPQLGERVVDAAGREWTVLGVERATLGTRWALWCRSIEISAGLDQRVTIQRANVSKGPHGEPVISWEDLRTQVPGKLQAIEAVVGTALDRRVTEVTHRLWTLETVEAGHELRVLHAGVAYRVVGSRQGARIDLPAVLDLVRVSWPL